MNSHNRDQLLTYLKSIEATGKRAKFNMNHWISLNDDDHPPECGTSACIAGHAVMIRYPKLDPSKQQDRFYIRDNAFDAAQYWLGLTFAQAELLFQPNNLMSISMSSISLSDAIKAVELMDNPEKVYEHWMAVAVGQFENGVIKHDPRETNRPYYDQDDISEDGEE